MTTDRSLIQSSPASTVASMPTYPVLMPVYFSARLSFQYFHDPHGVFGTGHV